MVMKQRITRKIKDDGYTGSLVRSIACACVCVCVLCGSVQTCVESLVCACVRGSVHHSCAVASSVIVLASIVVSQHGF